MLLETLPGLEIMAAVCFELKTYEDLVDSHIACYAVKRRYLQVGHLVRPILSPETILAI